MDRQLKAILILWLSQIICIILSCMEEKNIFLRVLFPTQQDSPGYCLKRNVNGFFSSVLKMISSPYCAVSAMFINIISLMFINIISSHSMECELMLFVTNQYLIFEAFQILFPTASLISTAAKLFYDVI